MKVVDADNYTLRPMGVEDIASIMRIEPTIYSHPWTEGNFRDSLNAGYSAWVVLSDHRIIAYALLTISMDEAQLLNLSVEKSRQNQGIGRFLLTHILSLAKQHGARNVFLEVRVSNHAAIALYETMGFCEMAVRRGYYPAKIGREDALLMGRAL